MTMPPVAASDASQSSSSHNAWPATKSSAGSKDTKLCHIVKRPDFDGYGFNLHSEKSKPGQFIGKIDANSPAEAAGLKEGDRIIEVNGLPVGNETHKQVVQRIKAIAWEVKLLVISESPADNVTKSPNKFVKHKMNNEQKPIEKTSNSSSAPASPPVDSNGSSKNASPLSQHANSANSAATVPAIFGSSKPSESSSTDTTDSPTPKVNGTLKLPSTAAEMRAILQSKKKHNPKSDEVNIQKKYDIIQKL